MNQLGDSLDLSGVSDKATMFRRQQPSSQQPLSLMTIDATPNRKPSSPTNTDNLLTIRILETSERKMQMLKKLLTPEEYNSIATDLFAGGDDIRAELASGQIGTMVAQHRHQATSAHRRLFVDTDKPDVTSVPMYFDKIRTKPKESATSFTRQLSKSESNLANRFPIATTSTNLDENLAQKRKALEFFFHEPPERIARNLGEDLAIELRSGHYLSLADPEVEEKVIQSGYFSWLDRLDGLLGLIGLSLPDFTRSDNDSDDDETDNINESVTDDGELFVKYYQKLNSEPYTRRRNLEIARKRLEADNQFNQIKSKILTELRAKQEQDTAGKETATTRRSRRAVCSNLIDLAQMHKSHALSSHKLLNSGQQFQVVQAIGHFNMIHLAGPKKFSQLIQDKPIELYHLSSSESAQFRQRRDLRKLSLPPQSSTQERRLRGSLCSQLKLNLLALKFKEHNLMLAEERAAFKLLEARDRMLELKNELCVASSRMIKMVEKHSNQLDQRKITRISSLGESPKLAGRRSKSELLPLLGRIGKMFKIRLQTIVNLKGVQDELLSISNELDSLRKEQGFNSTQIRVITKRSYSTARNESVLVKEALGRLAQSIRTSSNTDAHSNQPSSVALERALQGIQEYQKLLDEDGKILGGQQQLDVEVQEFGLDLTPNDECPSEEIQRRRNVKSFLKSLTVKVLIGEQYKYDCSNAEADSCPSGAFSLDLRENKLTLPLPLPPMMTTTATTGGDDADSEQQHNQVGLKIEVYTKGRRFLPFSQRLIGVAETKLPLDFGAAKAHSIWVRFSDSGADVSDQKGEAKFEFFTAFINHHRQEDDKRRFQFERLVNSLFSLTLNTNHHRLDDLKTKLAKLANHVDTSLLLAWIAKPAPGKPAWGSYFALDPFEVRFSPASTVADGFAHEHRQQRQVCESIQREQQQSARVRSIRHALLVWRWINNLGNQPIYLSERENITAFSLQVCEQELRSSWLEKTKSGKLVKGGQLGGYKSIEQTRALAAQFLKRFEHDLLEVLKFKAELEMLAGGNGASSIGGVGGASRTAARLADLLREPKLRVEFPDLVQIVRRMSPRRTANRPLMRKRKAHRFSSAAGAHVAAELEQSARTFDLEGQVFSQWQRFTSAHRSVAGIVGLNLVVTIQQATNVPMRVISSSSLPAQQIRPTSPFFLQQQHQQQQQSAGATSPTTSFLSLQQAGGSLGGSIQAPQSNYALAPPTTYVEIVFQRKQQASSLSQGKNPSWNETLFFPVDVARFEQNQQIGDSTGAKQLQQQQQLVDEFLQLNLYDYNCYLQADTTGDVSGSSMLPTMPMISAGQEQQQQLDWISQSPGATNSDQVMRGARMLASRQRVERHLLGSLRVPLTTLLSSGRIEGSFALSQPLFLDSYQFERDRLPLLGSVTLGADRRGASSLVGAARGANCQTHIGLFITLDPAPVSFPLQLYLPIGAYESQTVFEYVRLWEQVVSQHRNYAVSRANTTSGGSGSPAAGKRKQLANRSSRLQSNRHIRALVLHQDAKYCLASRLLTPLKPPRELLAQVQERLLAERASGEEREQVLQQQQQQQQQQQRERQLLLSAASPPPTWSTTRGQQQQQIVTSEMRALARFVSLLSPLKYGLFSMRQLASSGGLWFDSWQLVNNSLGGPEEKAVLLASYFLHLGKSSAILLGDAIPEGRCVYVIVWHEQSRFIEDRLPLQAMELLSSGGSGRHNAARISLAADELGGLNHQAPVEQQQFISRLPILINSRSIQLWDPVSGKSYWLSDQLPLISVGSIITMENVYANIQSIEKPSETNYDIRSKNFWFPLFETSSASQMSLGQAATSTDAAAAAANTTSGQQQLAAMRAAFDKRRAQQMSWRHQLSRLEVMRKSIGRPPIRPVISEGSVEFDYGQLSASQCRELRDSIEQVLKAHLLKWRPNRPTYFNRTLSRLLDEKLALCEHLCLSDAELQQDWQTELASLIRNEVLVAHLSSPSGLSSRKVISWPMNLPYTSMKSILDSLFASGVHNADLILADSTDAGLTSKSGQSSSTQFLVACHVHAYPAKVVSVWLYVAAILTSSRESQRFLLS